MRDRYKLCTTNDEPDDEGWPYSLIFHTRLENAIPLNASLSKTASNATYDQTKVENLKSLLFKDCHDSRTEFINLHTNGRLSSVREKRKGGQHNNCCSCWYKWCNHYGDIKGLSKESLAYYRAVCPMCVMTLAYRAANFGIVASCDYALVRNFHHCWSRSICLWVSSHKVRKVFRRFLRRRKHI